jgi:hypothetical protein
MFYLSEQGDKWREYARRQGVTIKPFDLDGHMQDVRDGYIVRTLPI